MIESLKPLFVLFDKIQVVAKCETWTVLWILGLGWFSA